MKTDHREAVIQNNQNKYFSSDPAFVKTIIPTCSCSFSLVLMTLNSLLATEVWVKSRESVGTRAKGLEDRPTRLYAPMEDALLRDVAMDLNPGEPRPEVLLMREEETENLGESPKIFR